MRKIAVYLLERRPRPDGPEQRKAEGDRIGAIIEEWLKRKGEEGDIEGHFTSAEGITGRWEKRSVQHQVRSWTSYRLVETTSKGQQYATHLSVTVGKTSVFLYVTLKTGWVSSKIAPMDEDMHCPSVVRTLLDDRGAWYHGETRLRRLTSVEGWEAGRELAEAILNRRRAIPFVVVSTMGGHPTLHQLDDRLADELAGLANVFAVDEEASWLLTSMLDKPLSCYQGAVRLYWPGFTPDDNPYQHPLWVANKLLSLSSPAGDGSDRFLMNLRRRIMRASALSVVRPKEIDEIHNAADEARFASMRADAKSLEDFRELADSYARENDQLRGTLASKEEEIADLQSQLSSLKSENASLTCHLRRARPEVLEQGHDNDDGLVEPDDITDGAPGRAPPSPGEVRFYKKVYSKSSFDIVVSAKDCGHNAWQGAAKADKAKKGIARFEGTDAWRSIKHCAKCTGGGMWRVQW